MSYDLKERFHLHISNVKSRKGKDAKIWLDPAEIFEKGNLTGQELKICLRLIEENKKIIKEQITNFAIGKKIQPLQLKIK